MLIEGHIDEISREEIHGWVMDRNRAAGAIGVVIMINGVEHGRCLANTDRPELKEHLGGDATGRYAFVYRFAEPLSHFKEHLVEVRVAETGDIIANGQRVLQVISGYRSGYLPVLVTSRGRTGTTMLMREFTRNPEIVVADIYPFEIKLASYYASLLKVLVSSKFTGSENDPDFVEHAAQTGQIGGNPWNRPALQRAIGGDDLEQLFRDSVPHRMAALFRGIILDNYGTIATNRNKPAAHLFAEKCSFDEEVRLGIRAILGEVRELILVRDPRDFLCSAKSFWHFDGERSLEIMERFIPALEALHASGERDVMFVRYEDLIRDVEPTYRRIGDFIGLRVPGWHTQPDAELLARHATSASPEASIGRWQAELTVAEVAACHDRFGSFMRRFDYSMDAPMRRIGGTEPN